MGFGYLVEGTYVGMSFGAELVASLAAARIGGTHNQYVDGPRAGVLRERLVAYVDARLDAPLLLVGEAPGYRGARVSGIPFTSERQLTGTGPAEATATIVHRVLRELDLLEHVLLWNVVPTHPGSETANRAPTREEVLAGVPFVTILGRGRLVIPVGRIAERALGLPGVRHPSRGGAARFRLGLREVVGVPSADHHPVPSPGPVVSATGGRSDRLFPAR